MTKNPCAKPGGIHNWRLFSADNTMPAHWPKVVELRGAVRKVKRVKALEKETPGIAEHLGFENQHIG